MTRVRRAPGATQLIVSEERRRVWTCSWPGTASFDKLRMLVGKRGMLVFSTSTLSQSKSAGGFLGQDALGSL
jgi:hypothetical protein